MDGEGQENNAQQQQEMEQQQMDGQGEQPQPGMSDAQMAQEEAMLEAQAQSLAEVKRRRKE